MFYHVQYTLQAIPKPLFNEKGSSKGEMVKTVIEMDDLTNRNAKSITEDNLQGNTTATTVNDDHAIDQTKRSCTVSAEK